MTAILVHVADFTRFGRAARFAAELAASMDASLTGLCLAPIVVPMLFVDAPAFLNDITDDLVGRRDRACAAEAGFLQWASARGAPRAAWQVVEGGLDAALATAGDWHDFSVIGIDDDSASIWEQPAAVGDLVVTSGHPVLALPAQGSTDSDPACVAVAWNGSREAMRAVHAALPLLHRAKRIVVLKATEDRSLETGTWHPPFSIQRYFEVHGLRFTVKPVNAAPGEAGAALLHDAAASDARLLVMGAYGRRRISEWVLGGATRHVLEHARLPVFMRH